MTTQSQTCLIAISLLAAAAASAGPYIVETTIGGVATSSKPLTIEYTVTADTDPYTHSLLCAGDSFSEPVCIPDLAPGPVSFGYSVEAQVEPFSESHSCQAWSGPDCTGLASLKWSLPFIVITTHSDDDVIGPMLERQSRRWAFFHVLDRWGWGIKTVRAIRDWARERQI